VGIDPVVLDAIATATRNRRGSNYRAVDTKLTEQAEENKAARRGFVAAAGLSEAFPDTADELPDRGRLIAKLEFVEYDLVLRIVDTGRDGIFVDVKTHDNMYIYRSRAVLLHGTVPLGVRDLMVTEDTILSCEKAWSCYVI
jgi:hypothetical protein